MYGFLFYVICVLLNLFFVYPFIIKRFKKSDQSEMFTLPWFVICLHPLLSWYIVLWFIFLKDHTKCVEDCWIEIVNKFWKFEKENCDDTK